MNVTEGGLAPPAELHQQLLAGWKTAMAQKIVEQATEAVTRRYRFQEKSR